MTNYYNDFTYSCDVVTYTLRAVFSIKFILFCFFFSQEKNIYLNCLLIQYFKMNDEFEGMYTFILF